MSEQVGHSSVSCSAGRTLRHALTAAEQLFVNGCSWPIARVRRKFMDDCNRCTADIG